jgi:hypothetical protein
LADQIALENNILADGIKVETLEKLWGKPDKTEQRGNTTIYHYKTKNTQCEIENGILIKALGAELPLDKLKIGMQKIQCQKILIQKPNKMQLSETANSKTEYWLYDRKAILIFEEDKLIQIERGDLGKYNSIFIIH